MGLFAYGQHVPARIPTVDAAVNADDLVTSPGLGTLPQYRFTLPMTEELPCNVSAHLIHPDSPVQFLAEGLEIIERAFPGQEAAYKGILRAFIPFEFRAETGSCSDASYSDVGSHIEQLANYVYRNTGVEGGEALPVGVGGLYGYVEKPGEFWLGRLAVEEAFRNLGYAELIIDHLCAKVAGLGGNGLFAYTADGPENADVHRWYETHGWNVTPQIFIEAGVQQRVYWRPIPLVSTIPGVKRY